jgi:hypothetical protein
MKIYGNTEYTGILGTTVEYSLVNIYKINSEDAFALKDTQVPG